MVVAARERVVQAGERERWKEIKRGQRGSTEIRQAQEVSAEMAWTAVPPDDRWGGQARRWVEMEKKGRENCLIGKLMMPSSTSKRTILYTWALSVDYAYVLYSNSDFRGAGDGECIEKV
jgi:hypothetical protein